MKLNGTFALREVAGEILVIPVGATALELNGMIVLNPTSKLIWECLEKGADMKMILTAVTDMFEVAPDEAEEDICSFLEALREHNLLID